uniref:U1-type domain-containing protein n=1 Tax=Polytomella parva TaxID=51329 RepID=A0A7S0VPF6_9CHLO|mmetsp:Transcript_856/g.1161  ORF Transcript_856/g.1161 Transcript_856/m.1161 type:complete len:219 (+) Transcript_856:401-1057(+)|eukprot:CAMPEP_0175054600 /NCGR_PEP_ID=MMETSP0052_2-20121109/9593_1 /TAXON_ID=51329 ORGANISM="Polytomella parva, Strain SAG 63-3" /NCGR_SAMPLE_ID=MMETSP0052_2 /ASSEMBLY_ACC=CAM_ASM_000194 /LENGTH=218 /DNA_ID=CAMNT_0016319309 /DNA_START=333 /DNA_END=989 /DNA_ORIENTATION=-
MSNKPKAPVDNTARRTWDKEEFTKKAEQREAEAVEAEETALTVRKRRRLERDPLHQGLITERANLKQREFQIDLASKLGKTQVVGFNTPLNNQAGFYCNVCDCVLRDSQSYLDHLNGKWHNRALGMNMRVERSTIEQVKNKFSELKQEKEKSSNSTTESSTYVPDGFDGRVSIKDRRDLEEEKRVRSKKKAIVTPIQEEPNADMMALMGFNGFGSSKK